MKPIRAGRCAALLSGALLAALMLPGCATKATQAQLAPQEWVLFGDGPAPGLRLQLAAPGGQVDVSGLTAATPNTANAGDSPSDAQLRRLPRRSEGDALELQWRNSWFTSLRLVAERPLDLRSWLPDATVEVDLNVLDVTRTGLSFAMGCGPGCGRKVSYVLPSRALQGLGWQHVAVPLRCFERDGNDFSAVTEPFVLDSGGSGTVKLSNVRLVRKGTPSVSCPDFRTESVTPTPLLESWAIDWWMPRHEQRLADVRAMKAAGTPPGVVFIGDSITEGWLKDGKKVWDEAFGRYHPLNLGYGGDRTENVLWRLQNGEIDGIAPKAVVLMIGTNNAGHRQEDPKTTAAGIRRLVQEVRERLPNSKLLVLAIFPRDEKPGTQLRRLNDAVNAEIAGLQDGHHVFFQDIAAALTTPDGTLTREVMPDLLHPGEQGYRRWASAMGPTLERLMAMP